MADKILEGPPFKSPAPKKTVGQLFFEKTEKYGEKTFQVDGTTDSSETYASVRLRSTRVAIELQRRGVTSKDVVSFCTQNSLDAVIPMIAAFYLGAKVANFEPSFSLRQTQHLMSLISTKVIFVNESSVGLIEDCLKNTQIKLDIIVFGQSDKYPTFADFSREQTNEENFKPSEVDVNDVALIFFCNDGIRKVACHTHNSYIHIACSMRDLNMGKVVLQIGNFYRITSHMLMLAVIMTGGTRVFLNSTDPKTFFGAIEKYKVNGTFGSSFDLNKLIICSEAKNFNTSSLTNLATDGLNLNLKKISQVFPHANIITMYGLTENGVTTAFSPEYHQELVRKKPSSVGKPFYGNKIKIVDEHTGNILGPNQKGEICILSPSLFQSYGNLPTSNYFDKDGFFKTGDIGYYDEEECLFLAGKIKEIFDYQGWHIAPAETEVVLLEHPSVEEAVVFGVPWGADGEAPASCVVLKDGATDSEEEIMDFVAEKVSDRMKLRGGIMFVKSLSKSSNGKVMRNEIRNFFINEFEKRQQRK